MLTPILALAITWFAAACAGDEPELGSALQEVCGTPDCACSTSADCDDGNECTTDVCPPNGPKKHKCQFTAVGDGTACTNGVCQGGTCEITCTPDCTGKVCGDDGCGGSCGSCGSGAACDSTCNVDGTACEFPAAGTSCDDGTACTSGEACDGAGTCVAGSAITSCTSGDQCCAAGCAATNDADCTLPVTGETPVDGTVSGSYTATASADGNGQSITEILVGNGGNRHSELEHQWQIGSVTGAGPWRLVVDGNQNGSIDGDSFQFAASSDGNSWTDLTLVVPPSATTTTHYEAPVSLTGSTLHVRVQDTDRGGGHKDLDTVTIDRLGLAYAGADLSPTALTAPGTVTPGQAVAMSWSVQNHGQGDAKGSYACCASGTYYYRWADVVYISADTTLDAGDVEVGRLWTADNFTLTPGSTYNTGATLTIPPVAGGSYYLLIATDGVNNRVLEQSDLDNTYAIPITVAPANLVVTAASAPPSAGAGELVSVSWTIANQGSGTAYASYLACCAEGYYNKWADVVYLSTDTTLSPDDLEAGRVWRSNGYTLAVGSNYSQTSTMAIPDVPAGSYYLLVAPDAIGQRVVETDETDLWAMPITVGRADLAAVSLGAPSAAGARELLSLSWTVTNQGTGGASGSYRPCCTDYYYKWADAVYLSTDPTFDAGDTELGRVWRSNAYVLGMGASYNASQSVQLPDVATGSYYLLLVTDAVGDRVPESNDTNNVLAVPLAIGISDLEVSQFSAPPQAGVQELITVSFTVDNVGTGGATGGYVPCCTDYYRKWADAVYLSTDATLDAGDTEIGRVWRGDGYTLPVAGTYTVETKMQLPVTAAGSYYLIVAADAVGDRVLEIAEDNTRVVPIVLRNADLAVQSMVAPATAGSQGLVDLSWVVTNIGTGGASGRYQPCCTDYYYKWADVVYLSSDATLDAGDTELGRVWTANEYDLGPGATYTQSGTFALPVTADGNYYLLVAVDGVNDRVWETSATNNVYSVPLSVGTADLTADLTAPSAVGAQSSATVSWVVTNTGSGPAAGKYAPCCTGYYYKWADVVFLSSDPVLDAGDTEVGRAWRSDQYRLAAGASYAVTATIDLPAATPGSYYLLLVTDGDGDRVAEASETNNLDAVPITVGQSDAVVTALGAPDTAASGQAVSVSFTVRNQGNAPAAGRYIACCSSGYYRKWADAIYLSTDATLDGGDTALATYWRSDGWTLNPGATYTTSVTVTLPAVSDGNYFLLVHADDVGDRLYESDEANNLAAHALTIGQAAPDGGVDLIVQGVGAPETAGSQELVTLSWTVRNQGTATATASYVGCCAEGYYNRWADVAYLSTDATLDAGDVEIGHLYTGNGFTLAGGATYAATAKLQMPSVAAGNYYVIVATDGIGDRVAGEDSETNNAGTAVPITIGTPDLTPVVFTAPANVGAGELVSVFWRVANQGSGPATGTYVGCCATGYYYKWADAIYLSTDATLDAGDTLVKTTWTANEFRLAAGGTYSNTIDIQIPAVAPGSYYLIVQTDDTGARVAESDEGNNTRVAPITVATPDLVASNLSGPAAVAVQELATFTWRVDNLGGGGATGSYIGCCATGYYYKWSDDVYLSTDEVLDAGDTLVGQSWRANEYTLAAGAGYTASLAVQIPQLADGSYYLLVVTDGTGARVSESDETNNLATMPITIGTADLVAKSFSGPTTAGAQELINLTWTVSNDGSRAATGKYQGCCAEGYYYKWADQIYLSTDAVLDAGDLEVGRTWRANQYTLAAGSAYTETSAFQLPAVADGSYYLILVSDGQGDRVYEADETNNSATIPITIGHADLVASNFTAPDQAASQELVSMSWTVTNQGTGGASGRYQGCCATGYYYKWADQVYLSTDGVLDAGDVVVGTVWRTNEYKLAAGGSYSVSATLALPDVAPGSYQLLLVSDGVGDRVLESDEGNNLVARPITMGKADLVATSMTGPAAAGGGELVALSFTIANQGTAAASGRYQACCATGYYYKWADTVYLSTDTVLSPDDEVVGTVWRADQFTLGDGASYTVNTSLNMPAVAGGTYYLIVSADDIGDRVVEDSETNNTVASTAITIGPADLVVTTATAPSTAGAQELVPLSWTVSNIGAGGATGSYIGCCATGYYRKWADAVYLSTDGTLSPDDVEVGRVWRPEAYTLSPDVSYTASTTLQLPAATPGAYQLLFVADAIGDRVAEDNEGDLFALPIQIEYADLVVSDATAPSTAGVNELVTLSWTVANTGGGGASGSLSGGNNKWADTVYLSTDAVLDAGDLEVTTQWRANQYTLAASGTYDVSVSVQLPTVAAGNYQLLFVTDSNGDRVLEASEANNLLARPLTIDQADLVIDSFSGPSAGAPQELLALTWTVRNAGGGAATGTYQACCADGYYYRWGDAVYLSTDGTLSPDDLALGHVNRANQYSLAAGGTYVVTASLPMPIVAPGSYQLILVTDGVNDRVGEADENNNVAVQPITVSSADLAVSDFTAPGSAGSDQLVNLSWTVTNPEAGGASGKYQSCCSAGYYYKWADRVVLSYDTTVSPDDVEVGVYWRPEAYTLAGGGSYTVTTQLAMPEVPGGDYYLLLAVDGVGDRVLETSEGNNTWVRTITIATTVSSDAITTFEVAPGTAEYMSSPSFSPDGAWLAASDGNRASVWDVRTGLVRGTFASHTGTVQSVKFSPIGDQVMSASVDGTVRIWDSVTFQQQKSFAQPISSGNKADFSGNGGLALVASGNTAKLWDVATSTQLGSVNHGDLVNAVAISADGTRALTGGGDGVAKLWDLGDFSLLGTLTGHAGTITAVDISPDGSELMTAGYDGTIRTWSSATFTQSTLMEQGYQVVDATYSSDGEYIVSGNHIDWGSAYLWLHTGALVATFHMPYFQNIRQAMTGVTLSPDRTTLAATYKENDWRQVTNGGLYTWPTGLPAIPIVPAVPVAVGSSYPFTVQPNGRYLFQIDQPAAQGGMFFRLSGVASPDAAYAGGGGPSTVALQVYSALGQPPSAAAHDDEVEALADALDAEIPVSPAPAGTYYLLVTAPLLNAGTIDATLEIGNDDYRLSALPTRYAGDAGRTTIRIRGTGLEMNSDVVLLDPGGAPVSPYFVSWRDATTMFATFDLTAKTHGQYGVQVTRTSDTAVRSRPAAVTLSAGTGPNLVVAIAGPTTVRIDRQYEYRLTVENTGDSDATSPFVMVTPIGSGHLYSPGGTLEVNGPRVWLTGVNGWPANVIPAGTKGTIKFKAMWTEIANYELHWNLIDEDASAFDWTQIETAMGTMSQSQAQSWAYGKSVLGSTNQEVLGMMRLAATYATGGGVDFDELLRLSMGLAVQDAYLVQ